MFYDSKPWVFVIIHLNQHAFLVLKRVTPTFSNLGTLLKIDIKNCPLLGKLLSVWRTVSVLPKSAQSAQTVENSHSFFNVSYTWYKSLDVKMSLVHTVAENRAEGNQVPFCFNAHLQSAAAKEKEWKTYTWFFGRSQKE